MGKDWRVTHWQVYWQSRLHGRCLKIDTEHSVIIMKWAKIDEWHTDKFTDSPDTLISCSVFTVQVLNTWLGEKFLRNLVPRLRCLVSKFEKKSLKPKNLSDLELFLVATGESLSCQDVKSGVDTSFSHNKLAERSGGGGHADSFTNKEKGGGGGGGGGVIEWRCVFFFFNRIALAGKDKYRD